MDKITQTIFEAILVKLEKIEQILINQGKIPNPINPKKPFPKKQGIKYATDNQKSYITRLGGETWDGMTHEEASAMIDACKSGSQAPAQKAPVESPEPKEFNDHVENKSLTPEEIADIGEENLL